MRAVVAVRWIGKAFTCLASLLMAVRSLRIGGYRRTG
jgi:hypothetical protein